MKSRYGFVSLFFFLLYICLGYVDVDGYVFLKMFVLIVLVWLVDVDLFDLIIVYFLLLFGLFLYFC